MKLTFNDVAAGKLGEGMAQVTVQSRAEKGADGKKGERPFATFYITLPSNYLSDIWALPKTVQPVVLDYVFGLVRELARTEKVAGRQSVELAETSFRQIDLANVTVDAIQTQAWYAVVVIPAMLAKEGKTAPELAIKAKAKQLASKLHAFPTLDRIEGVTSLIQSLALSDPYSVAMLGHCARVLEELTTAQDDVLSDLFGEDTEEKEKPEDNEEE